MAGIGTAYDLSLYETEQERHIARKEKNQSVIIKAQTKFAFGKKILNIIGIAALFSLITAVIATNASITSFSRKIAKTKEEMVLLQSEKSYLEFTLESRMTLDEIESYAMNNLGMVKMDASQKKYVELENQNKIVINDSPVKEKLTEAIRPLMSYLLP